MSFPVIADVGHSVEGVNITTHDVVVPAGISARQLLLLLLVTDGNPVISGMPSGWLNAGRLDSTGGSRSEVWWKRALGDEVNFTWTSSAAETSISRCYRVIGWDFDRAPEVAMFAPATPNINPDPPNLAPSWELRNTLWIAAYGIDSANTATAYPASYDDNQFTGESGGAAACAIAVASRNLAATSENPGAFTALASEQWVGVTIAIPPIPFPQALARQVRYKTFQRTV